MCARAYRRRNATQHDADDTQLRARTLSQTNYFLDKDEDEAMSATATTTIASAAASE